MSGSGAAEHNGIGQTDILWQNLQTGERCIWLMTNTAQIGHATLWAVDPAWQIVR